MIQNLVGIFSQVFAPQTSTAVTKVNPAGANPFASRSSNPFLSMTGNNETYGKNKPVRGGYFAGYYNGKPNIVGRKLFIEA